MKRPWTLIPVLVVYFGLGYLWVGAVTAFREWSRLYVTSYILAFWGGWAGYVLSKRIYLKINKYLDGRMNHGSTGDQKEDDHDRAGTDQAEKEIHRGPDGRT